MKTTTLPLKHLINLSRCPLALLFMAVTLHAATITVTNTNDSGAGSLRAAIQVANDGDTIDATGVSGTILLTSGQLYINPSVTIIGPGAGNLAVNGNATFRVFQTEGSNTTISGLTITNGVSENGLGGGGILNHGGLTVIDTSIVNNDGGDDGGGIYSTFGALPQTLTVMNSTISNNVPGGIEVCCAYETLTVTDSTISDNSATAAGGGIWNGHQVTSLIVKNSTFNGNSAPTGGTIWNNGGGTVQMGNTILNAGASGGTIESIGPFTSLGYNLASDDGGGVLTSPGDQINTNPMLGPLQDNGGPTFTHALLHGSPAINAGDPNFTPPPSHDQRGPGFPRVFRGRIDIGSFEVQRRR